MCASSRSEARCPPLAGGVQGGVQPVLLLDPDEQRPPRTGACSSGSPPVIVSPPPRRMNGQVAACLARSPARAVVRSPRRIPWVSGFWQYWQRSGQPDSHTV